MNYYHSDDVTKKRTDRGRQGSSVKRETAQSIS